MDGLSVQTGADGVTGSQLKLEDRSVHWKNIFALLENYNPDFQKTKLAMLCLPEKNYHAILTEITIVFAQIIRENFIIFWGCRENINGMEKRRGTTC